MPRIKRFYSNSIFKRAELHRVRHGDAVHRQPDQPRRLAHAHGHPHRQSKHRHHPRLPRRADRTDYITLYLYLYVDITTQLQQRHHPRLPSCSSASPLTSSVPQTPEIDSPSINDGKRYRNSVTEIGSTGVR